MQAYDKKGRYLQDAFQVWFLECAAWFGIWCGRLSCWLCLLATAGVGRIECRFSWGVTKILRSSGCWIALLYSWDFLQDRLGLSPLGRLAFLTNAASPSVCLCADACCELVIWGSFVDYAPVFFVRLAFEYYMSACLEFCAQVTGSRMLCIR